MKLQIAFDLTDLNKALTIAEQVQEYADILEIGSLLLYTHGITAITQFKEAFPHKLILADTKIADNTKEIVTLAAQAKADWITVLAGTTQSVIHNACVTARDFGKKVMLDLVDSSSFGQSALEAKSLGVDALLFHRPLEEDTLSYLSDNWEIVKGNTTLPIFISTRVTRENIASIAAFNSEGIIIGKAITDAENPAQEAEYFFKIINS